MKYEIVNNSFKRDIFVFVINLQEKKTTFEEYIYSLYVLIIETVFYYVFTRFIIM